MKVCIIGGGPAGLHTARSLLAKGIKTTLHEKEAQIGGLYKYSLLPASKFSPFTSLMSDKNFSLNLNSSVDLGRLREMENDFDAFVIATGARGTRKLSIPGNEHCKDGLELVKSWFESKDQSALGRKVLIIGMGNVSMDIVKLLFRWESPFFKIPLGLSNRVSVSDVTISSRGNIYNSAFTNPSLRSVLEIPNLSFSWDEGRDKAHRSLENKDEEGNIGRKGILGWLLNWKNERKTTNEKKGTGIESANDVKMANRDLSVSKERWWGRRKKLFEVIKAGTRSLRLLFNTEVKSIASVGDKYRVELVRDGITRKECFDSVISSVGFDPMDKKGLEFRKPVYYVGWARDPKGHAEEVKADAYEVASIIAG